MMSLKNSNKRKGYKERLTGSSGPKKLVFCDPEASRPPDVPPEPEMGYLPPPTPRTSRKPKLSHLIPPSETVDLPANIFVTSIDVEADLWQQRPGTKRAKTAVSNVNGADNRRSGHGGVSHEERTGYAPQFEEDVILNYGDPEDTNIREQIPDSQPRKVDWDAVESDFRSLPNTDVESLSVGAVVAWQVGPCTLPRCLSEVLTFANLGSWDRLLNSDTGNALTSWGGSLCLRGRSRGWTISKA